MYVASQATWHICPSTFSFYWGSPCITRGHPYWWGCSALLSLLIQMLISSLNTLRHTQMMSYQLSVPLTQSSWHIQLITAWLNQEIELVPHYCPVHRAHSYLISCPPKCPFPRLTWIRVVCHVSSGAVPQTVPVPNAPAVAQVLDYSSYVCRMTQPESSRYFFRTRVGPSLGRNTYSALLSA